MSLVWELGCVCIYIHILFVFFSPKAAAFCSQSSEQLCEWLSGIGLSMYSDLVMDKHVTGERLAEMVAEPTNQHLVVSTSCTNIPPYLLPARASEQGNVIGSVRIYIYMCVQKKL